MMDFTLAFLAKIVGSLDLNWSFDAPRQELGVQNERDYSTIYYKKITIQEFLAFLYCFSLFDFGGDRLVGILGMEESLDVKGLEFKKALWGIWFGDKPVDSGLKNAMLGKV